MKFLKEEQMEFTQGGKFWGKECKVISEPYYHPGHNQWVQNYECAYFVFWIPFNIQEITGGYS